MSIDGINGTSNPWRGPGGPTGSGSAAGNGGTPASVGTTSFMQALSAELQSMLTQTGSNGASTGSASVQMAANRPVAGTHHHHHHESQAGTGALLQNAANQVSGK